MFLSTIIWPACIGLAALAAVALDRGDTVTEADRQPAEPCVPPALDLQGDFSPELHGEPPAPRRKRVLVIGSGKVGHMVAEKLERQGCVVVGFADDMPVAGAHNGWPVLGDRDSVLRLVKEHGVGQVVVAYAPTWQEQLVEDLLVAQPGLQVGVVPSHYESLLRTPRVSSLGGVAVASLTEPRGRIWDGVKRTLDVSVSLFGLVITAPLFGLTAGIIRLTSPGPVFYSQERVGRQGKVFLLHKFRTMRVDAEATTGPMLSPGKEDERLTRVGRILRNFRIDELPQLWNVVRGDMSLVGPRPERPCFVATFIEQTPLYSLRHEVRPGITGLAQVLGGYLTDARDKLRFDLIYLAHRSLWLDVKILAQTALVVLRSEGS